MATEAVKRPLPGSYSEMYPSRFLKADMLKGKRVTMTIKAIFGEDLVSAEDEATKPEWIVQFAERPFEWVMNKSNAFCLYRMFGGDPHSWVGHKITIFPQPGTWFGEKGEAIRVWGSPELTEDMPITLKFLRRKKDRNMVMHRVVASNGIAPPTEPKPDFTTTVRQPEFDVPERIAQLFTLLTWGRDVQASWLVANANLSDADKLAKLSKELE
jgi:hypothetical protein